MSLWPFRNDAVSIRASMWPLGWIIFHLCALFSPPACSEKWIQYSLCENVTCLAVSDTVIYAGTESCGVLELSTHTGRRMKAYNTSNTMLPSNTVTATAVSPEGVLWVGTKEGIVSFHEGEWRDRQPPGTLRETEYDGIPTVMSFDREGALWVGLSRVGIRIYREDRWDDFLEEAPGFPMSILRGSITDIEFDPNGAVWICVRSFWGEGESLHKYDGVDWTSYATENTVFDIAFDSSGTMWAVGPTLGAVTLAEDTVSPVRDLPSEVARWNMKKVLIDSRGVLWIGTSEGIVRYDGGLWEYDEFAGDDSFYGNSGIAGMVVDDAGHIWYADEYIRGGSSDLFRFDGTEWSGIGYETSPLPCNSIADIALCTDGSKWLSSGAYSWGGLYEWKEGRFIRRADRGTFLTKTADELI